LTVCKDQGHLNLIIKWQGPQRVNFSPVKSHNVTEIKKIHPITVHFTLVCHMLFGDYLSITSNFELKLT